MSYQDRLRLKSGSTIFIDPTCYKHKVIEYLEEFADIAYIHNVDDLRSTESKKVLIDCGSTGLNAALVKLTEDAIASNKTVIYLAEEGVLLPLNTIRVYSTYKSLVFSCNDRIIHVESIDEQNCMFKMQCPKCGCPIVCRSYGEVECNMCEAIVDVVGAEYIGKEITYNGI